MKVYVKLRNTRKFISYKSDLFSKVIPKLRTLGFGHHEKLQVAYYFVYIKEQVARNPKLIFTLLELWSLQVQCLTLH